MMAFLLALAVPVVVALVTGVISISLPTSEPVIKEELKQLKRAQ